MKRNLGLIAAALMFCCALLVGTASQARAEECTTQGALALALADVLGIQATSAQAAADSLAAISVGPALGWNVEACLTAEVSAEISQSFAALKREEGGFERAMNMIRPGPDGSAAKISNIDP
jgi:hypothetical protein